MMIEFTLGDFQEIDKLGEQMGKYHIWVEISFSRPLYFQRQYWVEDTVEFLCKFHYDKLFGCCGVCGFVTHIRLLCSGPTLDEDDVTVEIIILGEPRWCSWGLVCNQVRDRWLLGQALLVAQGQCVIST